MSLLRCLSEEHLKVTQGTNHIITALSFSLSLNLHSEFGSTAVLVLLYVCNRLVNG